RECTQLNGDIALRQNAADHLSTLVAEHVLLQLRHEGLPGAIGAVVRQTKQGFVAIPGIPQPGYALRLAFNTDVVGRRDEQQPECSCGSASRSENTQSVRAELGRLRRAEFPQKAGCRERHSAE